ncbi:hypothetical protein MP228_005968 [Amoeboaphelidium protococcarum]|nr:hypothetical protein MP228_005968 [Amoeboaphelidium protococcarum]
MSIEISSDLVWYLVICMLLAGINVSMYGRYLILSYNSWTIKLYEGLLLVFFMGVTTQCIVTGLIQASDSVNTDKFTSLGLYSAYQASFNFILIPYVFTVFLRCRPFLEGRVYNVVRALVSLVTIALPVGTIMQVVTSFSDAGLTPGVDNAAARSAYNYMFPMAAVPFITTEIIFIVLLRRYLGSMTKVIDSPLMPSYRIIANNSLILVCVSFSATLFAAFGTVIPNATLIKTQWAICCGQFTVMLVFLLRMKLQLSSMDATPYDTTNPSFLAPRVKTTIVVDSNDGHSTV